MRNESKKKRENVDKKIKKSKIFGIIFLAVILILVVILIFKLNPFNIDTTKNNLDMNKTENVEIIEGEKVNNSEKMKEIKIFEILDFEITKLSTNNEKVSVEVRVSNKGNETFEGKSAQLVFYDKNGNECGKLDVYVGKINSGESVVLEVTTTLDISNAYDYKVTM